MSANQSLLGPAGRSLSGHLERLRTSLSVITRQLCESVSSVLGRAAAEAVRQAVASLMRQPEDIPVPVEEVPYRRDARPSFAWSGQEEYDRFDDWREPDDAPGLQHERRWRDSQGYEPDDDYPRPRPSLDTPSAWRSALAAGCRLVAWLLGQLAAPGARLLALSAGLATAVALYLVGPSGGPGALGALTDALTAGASALRGLAGA
jgi:hypothetical protein